MECNAIIRLTRQQQQRVKTQTTWDTPRLKHHRNCHMRCIYIVYCDSNVEENNSGNQPPTSNSNYVNRHISPHSQHKRFPRHLSPICVWHAMRIQIWQHVTRSRAVCAANCIARRVFGYLKMETTHKTPCQV